MASPENPSRHSRNGGQASHVILPQTSVLSDYTRSALEDQGCKSEPCSFDNTEINMSLARQVCQEMVSRANPQPKGSRIGALASDPSRIAYLFLPELWRTPVGQGSWHPHDFLLASTEDARPCDGFDVSGNVHGQRSACPHGEGTCLEASSEVANQCCFKVALNPGVA